jgi:hypothetical protein
MDGRKLRKLFAEFNEKYFGGRLPAYAIRVGEFNIARFCLSGNCNRSKSVIEVSSRASADEPETTLLHQMAHAAAGAGHGMPWRREMIRLREAGAPLSGPDRSVQLDDCDGDHAGRYIAL